jgi:hypothetical protein
MSKGELVRVVAKSWVLMEGGSGKAGGRADMQGLAQQPASGVGKYAASMTIVLYLLHRA